MESGSQDPVKSLLAVSSVKSPQAVLSLETPIVLLAWKAAQQTLGPELLYNRTGICFSTQR